MLGNRGGFPGKSLLPRKQGAKQSTGGCCVPRSDPFGVLPSRGTGCSSRPSPPLHKGTFQWDGVIPCGTCGMWGSPKPSQGVHPDPGAPTRSPRCQQPQPVPQQVPVSPPALSHLGPAAPKCKRRPPSYRPSPQNLPIPCSLHTTPHPTNNFGRTHKYLCGRRLTPSPREIAGQCCGCTPLP